MGVWIRRIIITVCIIALLPNIISFFSGISNGVPKDIKEEVKAGNATIVDLHKDITIEQDKITFRHLVLSDHQTSLIYEVHTKENGWSFPSSAIALKDRDGNTYQHQSGSSSGHAWGEYIVNDFEAIPKNAEEIIIDFEWFDRSFQFDLSNNQEER